MTNGSKLLIGVRGSSKFGRRYADLVRQFTEELGGDLTAFEMGLIKQAAALSVRSEAMQADIVNGVAVNPDDLIRLSSEVRRILDAVATKSAKSKPKAPSLSEYLAQKAAEDAA